jgi:NADPH-dependent 2,4-dienoyl-CoA reductase/sulfur reductase-like enzyme
MLPISIFPSARLGSGHDRLRLRPFWALAMTGSDYDVVVIGSGFRGSVAALRLTEKGYRVAVLEAGRRFGDPTGT